MRLNPRFTSAFMLAALLVWTVPARADPITAVYNVQVLERRDSILMPPEPFSQQFELRMSFDPDANGGFHIYGSVSFSSIPLAVPEQPTDLFPLQRQGRTSHYVAESAIFPHDPVVFASAEEVWFGFNDEAHRGYQRNIHLFGIFPNPPLTLNAENFPVHLGSVSPDHNSPFNFYFTDYLCVGAIGEDCFDDPSSYVKSYVAYSGIATLREVESPVVPEPATLALVGGGLALLAARRRRSRQTGS
jgi:hypothetical protein